MAKIIILYGTNNGQARKVAEHIAEVVKKQGHAVEMAQGNKAFDNFSPQGFDAAIIGTSIYMGTHQISVKKLVKANSDVFNRIPSAYFCVCLTATQTSPEAIAELDKYVKNFTDYTGLKPVKTAVFAGALKYPDYNFVKRFSVKLLARKLGLDTDTKNHFEYTDWNAVTRFAEEFAESVKTSSSV
ncbi:MAG: flavodoxin domain-containing protein [Dehalococcoidia bacterium]|nr:flavodoxin domain-containing protein [Dehalococcoidia bacterium]